MKGRWPTCVAVALLSLVSTLASGVDLPAANPLSLGSTEPVGPGPTATDVVSNFTSAIQRLVELVGFAGSGLLTLVWVRVALSWFSNDLAKKIQAKDRARDALIGTLIFSAALSGLVWGLAHWVFTGS